MDQKLNSSSVPTGNGITMIPMPLLIPFRRHPFLLQSDEKIAELAAGINHIGLQHPIIVRASDNKRYEILAGHNRVEACKLLEWKYIPSIIKHVTDAEAMNIVVYTNLQQREQLLHSERAKAYAWLKTQPDAVFPLGTGVHLEISRTQLFRYERILKLIPPLLDRVDCETLPFQLGVDLSFLVEASQTQVNDFFFVRKEARLNKQIVKKLRDLSSDKPLSEDAIREVVSTISPKRGSTGLVIPYDRIKPYYKELPPDESMIEFFMELLDFYANDEAVREAYKNAAG